MKNLEQIRALHALKARDNMRGKDVTGKEGGDVIRGLSSLILSNGLLATLAFAKAQGKGYETIMVEIGKYLSSTGPDGRNLIDRRVTSLDEFIQVLTEKDSNFLAQVTAETLAFLSYLKRFVQKEAES